jgi:drug/metabolite transporter (DMT)-like permease
MLYWAGTCATIIVAVSCVPSRTLYPSMQAVTSVAAALIMKEPLGWKGSSGVLVSLVGVVVSQIRWRVGMGTGLNQIKMMGWGWG